MYKVTKQKQLIEKLKIKLRLKCPEYRQTE